MRLKQHFESQSIPCEHICFDQLYSFEDDKCFDAEEWKRKQYEMIEEVRRRIVANAKELDVILVDDNMYYNSMRSAYYVMAREIQVAMCIIFVIASLNTCIQRNAQRTSVNRVPDKVIYEMYEKIEYDTPSSLVNSIVIDNDVALNSSSQTTNLMDNVVKFILDCAQHPLKNDKELLSIEQERSREANKKLLHSLDLALRKRVNNLLLTSNINNDNRKEFALKCRRLKNYFFNEVKSGRLQMTNRTDTEFIHEVEQMFIDQILKKS